MGLDRADVQVPALQAQTKSADIPHREQPWYAAYMAALFESNRKQIRERINYAKQLILARERELLANANDPTERRALNNALHALHALASCLNV
jgi:DNA-directed RNA polymerase